MNCSLSESVTSVKETDRTYFPPQKIFVVITRLERLKNKSKSLRTSVTQYFLQKPKKTHAYSIKAPTYHLENQVFLDFCNMPTSHSKCDPVGLANTREQWVGV